MDTRGKSNAEFHLEVLNELQGLRVARSLPTNSSDINPFYTGESSNANNGTHNPHLKLAFPKFNGDDPSGWIYNAEQYFDFKGVAADQQFRGPVTWPEMTKAILLRFGPIEFDDPSEALTWLHQTTFVVAYQEFFERLSHRVDGLPEHFLVGCLIASLRDDIRLDVKIKNPHTLAEPIDVAKTELQEVVSEISFHAIAGANHPQTIRVLGKLKNRELMVLIDGGSTHNFIDQAFASKFRLLIIQSNKIHVVVANKERIECVGLCRDLTVIIQGTLITADYYILPVAACPLVLGVQWLATLGPIKIDYSKLTMMFQQAGVPCTFQGLSQGGIDVFTDKDFYHLQGPGFFLHLVATKSTDTNGAQ
ncbi:hypothetical protein FEM48_Zijuj05G0132800 [Ziziphus jujuba var. spinosa]|uniref:Retrotransposon gag domain-containing protein n=1 Tax=Ziziphus jujuba var. spinosa TaxID=714518 RepID=A0A978VF19_ZIZJJ|nr:hypothetical protein FEM48_Zijuj05G0132800 [Ziziphus jujuba var. spinosa]